MRSSSSPLSADARAAPFVRGIRDMLTRRPKTTLALLVSGALHVLLVSSIDPATHHDPEMPDEAAALVLLPVTLAPPPVPPPEVAPPAPLPPPPPRAEPVPPRAELKSPSAPAPRAPEAPSPPDVATPESAPPEPGPLLMTTPGSAGGDGFVQGARGGQGTGRAISLPAVRPAPSAEAAAPAAAAVVPLANLSSPPRPPSLNGALRRLYPDEARRAGRGGEATVRARVGPSGAIAETRLDAASEPAFGAACRSLLAHSQWSPPLDRGGRPVSTWIRYTCRFAADR